MLTIPVEFRCDVCLGWIVAPIRVSGLGALDIQPETLPAGWFVQNIDKGWNARCPGCCEKAAQAAAAAKVAESAGPAAKALKSAKSVKVIKFPTKKPQK